MNKKWLSKKRKVVFNPPTLFNFCAATIANKEIEDKFAWKLISQHKNEYYTCISKICYRCINWGLDTCVEHRLYHSVSYVRGDNLEFADYTAVLPYNKY